MSSFVLIGWSWELVVLVCCRKCAEESKNCGVGSLRAGIWWAFGTRQVWQSTLFGVIFLTRDNVPLLVFAFNKTDDTHGHLELSIREIWHRGNARQTKSNNKPKTHATENQEWAPNYLHHP